MLMRKMGNHMGLGFNYKSVYRKAAKKNKRPYSPKKKPSPTTKKRVAAPKVYAPKVTAPSPPTSRQRKPIGKNIVKRAYRRSR